VYIAYGRDEQAEEILKEALRTQPDRQAVRVKLLEIYAHRKDAHTFETVASELYGMTGGDGPDWAQAAALGAIIDPQNPLYAGGQSDVNSAALGASTLPVESLDPEALLGNSLQQEMLDSITFKADTSHSMMMNGDADDHHQQSETVDDGLDFDLGLAPGAEVEFSPAAPVDLPGEIPVTPDLLPEEIASPEHGTAEVVTDDLPPLSSEKAASAPADKAAGAALDFAALDFDFDIPNADSEESVQIESESESHPDDAVSAHDSSHAKATPALADNALDYDLSSIDLDLAGPVPDVTPQISDEIPDFSAENLVDFNLGDELAAEPEQLPAEENIEFNAEMATKLDLAAAYHEIGDKDGARELLDEVLKAGTEEQIARAKNLMQELA